MKALRCLLQGEHVNIRREQGIDVVAEALRLDGARQPQVRHLCEGMDAGVGTARPHQLDRLSSRLLDGPDQLSGHGAGVLLLLPAAVPRSFVLDRQPVGGQAPSGAAPDPGPRAIPNSTQSRTSGSRVERVITPSEADMV